MITSEITVGLRGKTPEFVKLGRTVRGRAEELLNEERFWRHENEF